MRGFLRGRQELSPGRISSFDGGHGVTRPGGRCGRGRDRDALEIIGLIPLLDYGTDPFRHKRVFWSRFCGIGLGALAGPG